MSIDSTTLRTIAIFQDLTDDILEVLSGLLSEETVSADDRIMQEGDPADAMYIIRSGELEMRKRVSREAGTYKTLSILEAGEIFGEMAVFGGETRSADVIARKDSVLWKLPYSALLGIIQETPSNGAKILQVVVKILSFRIQSLNTELATLHELSRILPQLNEEAGLTDAVIDLTRNAISPAEGGLLAIYNVFNEEFDIHRAFGTIRETHISRNDPLSTVLFTERSPIIVRDSSSEPDYRDSFYSGGSFIASPFMYDESLLGFILLNSSQKGVFNYSHSILLSAVCSQVAYKLSDLERKKDDVLKKRLEQGKLTV